MNSRAPITSFTSLENNFDFLEQDSVSLFPLTWLLMNTPYIGVVAASGNLKKLAHQSNSELVLMIGDKLELHVICLAK
jgi:hypothetical protein